MHIGGMAHECCRGDIEPSSNFARAQKCNIGLCFTFWFQNHVTLYHLYLNFGVLKQKPASWCDATHAEYPPRYLHAGIAIGIARLIFAEGNCTETFLLAGKRCPSL